MCAHLISRIKSLAGWRRNALAFAAGIGATLALPPLFLLPFLIPAFCILYWLTESAPTYKRAFADGWWWGMGWHVTGLYWFCIALLTDPQKYAWLIPFTLIGLNAILALYAACACLIWKRLAIRGYFGVLAFSAVWALVEYARGHLFTGFPWNLAGYGFAASDLLLQPAAILGIYGLTWFIVYLALLPLTLVGEGYSKRAARIHVGGAYGVLVALLIWGGFRLQTETQYVPNMNLRLVQANISQHHKWDPLLRRRGLDEYLTLSHGPGVENATTIIWPETAVPYAFHEYAEDGASITRLLASVVPQGASLIAGGLRIEGDMRGAKDEWNMYNSIVTISSEGDIKGYYDKVRLVPFGEFLPFRSYLPDTAVTPAGGKDFSTGNEAQTLSWPGLPPVSPLVCYEAIFPEFVVNKSKRPEWMLNLTNDAWFGISSGPHQHFQMARMRAVEQGLPLVRVANTGITAIVDSYGRITGSIGLGEKGVLDAKLPVSGEITFYAVWGEIPFFLLTIGALGLILSQRPRRNN